MLVDYAKEKQQRTYLTVKTWSLIITALILARFSKLNHLHLFLKTFPSASCIYFPVDIYSFATFGPLFTEEKF